MDSFASSASVPGSGASPPGRRSSPPRLRKRYRGGFTTSICDIFRAVPDRRTDCCAVACCGVLAGDRTRFLLRGERPPPLYLRILVYLIVPAFFFTAMMGRFAIEYRGGDGQEDEEQALEGVSPGIFGAFVLYIIFLVAYGFVKNQSTRKEIMVKLYEERKGERGEEVNPAELREFLSHYHLDTVRAHGCFGCCYPHDRGCYDEATGMVNCDGHEEVDDIDRDFCTRLWDGLAGLFWCCGGWCQCCGICALAQEGREVDRLTDHEEHRMDYLTFQPFSEYRPLIQALREERSRNPLKHLRALSELSGKLVKNISAALIILIMFAVADLDKGVTRGNILVLILTLGQAFFIEYLVHWKWNLFDLSLDSVVKCFACGFLLITPMATIFEILVSIFIQIIYLISIVFVIASDNELANDLATDPKEGLKSMLVNYPALFILLQLTNAFVIAALIEELLKYFGHRMVVTPDLLLQGMSTSTSRNNGDDGSVRSLKSTGAGITVAMVSVALGFACCENLMYIFVYAPPSLGIKIATLVARSLYPVHPLCAAIQSIGVCRRDLEADKGFGIGKIIFPAVMLHGTFDSVMMISSYILQRKSIMEGDMNRGDASSADDDETLTEDLLAQLPALISGFALIVVGYAYYAIQSRAQTQRLVAMDNAMSGRSSELV